MVFSLLAFIVGFALGYIFYIGKYVDPNKFVNSNLVFYSFHKLIINRWYLNTLIYWCFIVYPLLLIRRIWRYFEKTVIDLGMNNGFEYAIKWSSNIIHKTQTGIVQSYLYVFGAGLLFILMILLV